MHRIASDHLHWCQTSRQNGDIVSVEPGCNLRRWWSLCTTWSSSIQSQCGFGPTNQRFCPTGAAWTNIIMRGGVGGELYIADEIVLPHFCTIGDTWFHLSFIRGKANPNFDRLTSRLGAFQVSYPLNDDKSWWMYESLHDIKVLWTRFHATYRE